MWFGLGSNFGTEPSDAFGAKSSCGSSMLLLPSLIRRACCFKVMAITRTRLNQSKARGSQCDLDMIL